MLRPDRSLTTLAGLGAAVTALVGYGLPPSVVSPADRVIQ